jgi:hypothetical protein
MFIKNFPGFGVLIVVMGALLNGQTVISGDLSKFALDSANNPFIVEKDIEVPSKKKVIINEGCIFLFKPFTGLNVVGSLGVNGTQTHPVVFTTINDSLYSKQSVQTANPFDWNGIVVDKNAHDVTLTNFRLMYSVYGVKSGKKDIVLKNGSFKANGQFNFTIFDKIQYVQENLLFSYPDDSAMVAIPRMTGRTYLSITSIPSRAEVYINKKPGKKISPDARTPATIKNIENSRLSLTLFKKGYADTTLALNIISGKVNDIEVTLGAIMKESIDNQNRLLRQRFHAQIGRCCFIASPVFLIIGAGFLYYAEQNYKTAKDAKIFLDNSLRPATDPQQMITQKRYNDETKKGDSKRNTAVAFFGIGALALGAGIIFYF